jgi:hypothetical protein
VCCDLVDGFASESKIDQLKILALFDLIIRSDNRFRVLVSGRAAAIVGKAKLDEIFQSRRCYEKLIPKYFYGLKGGNLFRRPNIYIPKDQLRDAYRQAVFSRNLSFVSKEGVRFRSRLKRNAAPVRRTTAHLSSRLNAGNVLRVDRSRLNNLLGGALCPSCEYCVLRLLALSSNEGGLGNISIHYERKWNGRLHDVLSIQNIPKWIKHVGLRGYHDYDIENCHFSLFSQLCNRLGIATPCIDAYSANRKDFRRTLCHDLGLPLNDEGTRRIKTALISIVYGSLDTHWKEAAIATALGGEDLAKMFNAHPLVRGIRGEVTNYSIDLIEAVKRQKTHEGLWSIKGGNSLTYKTKLDSAKERRRALSFLLTSHESHILDVVLRKASRIDLCMHDGWICRSPLDLNSLTEAIKAETNFEVQIDSSLMNGQVDQSTCTNCAKIILSGNAIDKVHLNQLVTFETEEKISENCAANGRRGGLVVSMPESALCSWSERPPYGCYPEFFR